MNAAFIILYAILIVVAGLLLSHSNPLGILLLIVLCIMAIALMIINVKINFPHKVKLGETEWTVHFNGRIERVLPPLDENGFSPLAPSEKLSEIIRQDNKRDES